MNESDVSVFIVGHRVNNRTLPVASLGIGHKLGQIPLHAHSTMLFATHVSVSIRVHLVYLHDTGHIACKSTAIQIRREVLAFSLERRSRDILTCIS